MPYKRRDPVPPEEMERDRYAGHFTICQYIRDIYHMTDDEGIRLKLRVAMAMSKAMNQKLQDYKHAEEEKTRREQDARSIEVSEKIIRTGSSPS